MHSLPCANGGEDGVCLALTQLSKGLIEDNTSGLQAGGCDSSDCLFCQYRSNSPFHLNAYAGKLTSLLKKRSHNGMPRTSLSSLVDTTTEQGAALMTATAAAMCNGGKRLKFAFSSGILASSAASSMLFVPSSSALAGADSTHAAAATAAASYADQHHPHALSDAPHDCGIMCDGRLCSEHAILRPAAGTTTPAGEAPAAAAAAIAAGAVAVDAIPLAQPSPSNAHFTGAGGISYSGRSMEAVQLVAPAAGTSDVAKVGSERARGDASPAPRPPPQDPGAEAAGPGPSSLRLSKLFRSSRHQQAQQQHHHHLDRNPLCNYGDRVQEGHLPAAGPQPDGRQQQQARHGGGRALPRGWTFRSEWQHQSDPAPAALQEVLQLPGAASFSRLQRRGGRPTNQGASFRGLSAAGSACGGSAGIVCALEFSPDGRLLAAGGVDKQIRLYNLGSAFGDWVDEDDIVDGFADDDDDDLDLLVLGALPGTEDGDRWAGGVGRVRRGRCCDGSGSDDENCSDYERDASLLAAVQRMPSKISSMAWSPFLDGVLTVGDYDGVLLQLHIASGHQLADVEAHGGRKIWSVAHSALTPHLVASAADDRCARLWAGRGLGQCVASVQPNPRAAVCSVDLSPTCEHLLAAACSDRTAYLYDMRYLGRGPLATLRHHSRPASYCRFLGGDRLVTAATDASLALWDISEAVPTLTGLILPPPGSCAPSPPPTVQEYGMGPAGAAAAACSRSVGVTSDSAATVAAGPCSGGGGLEQPWRVFRGHRNEKNFVGLSVRAADGLLACGSECSRAFAYHTSWSDPLATLELPWCANTTDAAAASVVASDVMCGSVAGAAGLTGPCHGGDAGSNGGGGRFVSAVCWQPAEAAAALGLPPLLASATSLGVVNISVLAAGH